MFEEGTTDVGTGKSRDEKAAPSSFVEKLNERFGTNFTKAGQLFFHQAGASAKEDEKIVEAAKANRFENYSSYFEQMPEELFIEQIECNEEIYARVMSDREVRGGAQDYVARELYERVTNLE